MRYGGDKIEKNSDSEEGEEYEVPEWIRDTPREDHRVISRALENPLRRKIMKFIGLKSEKKLEEIAKEFDLANSEAKTHLGFLEDAEIIEKVSKDPISYKLDEIGRKYLRNVEKIK